MVLKLLYIPPPAELIKLLRIMKITAILMLCALLQVSAKTYSQQITLQEKNARLDKVFDEINRQSGYEFVYTIKMLQAAKPVDIDVKNASIDEVLSICFQDQPFSFTIIEKTVVIKPKTASITTPETASPQVEIHGRVTNEQGQPIENANVVIKRTKKGTTTNANGEFTLKDIRADDEITISFVGYEAKTIKKAGTNDHLTLTLKEATDELDKAVVQAYGKTSQRYATGNIATVTAAEIEKQPVMNPLLALQGRVAGLVVTPVDGYASGRIKVEIRGRNSINSNFISDPLYVIDGVPLTVLEINGSIYNTGSFGFDQLSLSPAGGQSPFFSINPADIESVEVLKDADATAIYGSRGANGVILITTKKGNAGKTKFDVSAYEGISAVTNHWEMLNTQQYLEMRREAFKNDNIIPTEGNAPDLLVWDTTKFTDWQKYLWGNLGKNTDVQAGLSGGDARTTFRVGASYHRQNSILTASGADQRGGASFDLTHKALNQRLSISFTGIYSLAQTDQISVPSAVILPPDAPPVYDKNGNLNYSQWNAQGGNQLPFGFPFANLLQPYSSRTNFLNSNLNLNYQIITGLSLRINFGYNNSHNDQTLFYPIASQNPVYNPTGRSYFGTNENTNLIVEPQLEYNGFIGKGKLNILVGGSAQNTKTDAFQVQGSGYTSDVLISSIAFAPSIRAVNLSAQYKYAAIFGRINYNWEDKYILNLNGRRDGSSRFGQGDQYGNFGSVGGAWIASEEKWLKRSLPSVFSFVKMRGSYGLTGSDNVGDYQYLSQWSSNSNYVPLLPYGGIPALTSLIQPNPNFHWQVTKKLEGALDLGFFKDRINLEAAYYRNRCNNQLVPFPTPEFTGFTSVTANSPANVQNSGWEFLLNAKVINEKNFTWTTNFNIGINKNTLIAYPNLAQSPYYNSLKIGQSLNEVYLLHYTGVNPQTGQYTYADWNHDGIININGGVAPGTGTDDRYVALNLSPKFTGGLGNNFSYKNWQLSAFFSFTKQMAGNAFNDGQIPGNISNQSVEVLNRWQKPGDIAAFARFTTNPQGSDFDYSNSDASYTDASFIRLTNLSISYNLPEHIAKEAGLQGCHLFLQGQNLFVITKYKGIDPETHNFGGMPLSKIFTGGISLNF